MDSSMSPEQIEQAREEALQLYQQGVKAQTLGDYPKAEDSYQRCLKIMKKIRNRNGEAAALHYLGTLIEASGDFPKARSLYEESFHLFELDEDFQNCLFSLFFQGILSLKTGEYKEGIFIIERSLSLAFDLGSTFIQEGWSRIRQVVGVLFAGRKIELLVTLGEILEKLGKELRLKESFANNDTLLRLAEMTQQLGVFFVGCGRFWLNTEEDFPEDEVTSWLLQTAVNLDQATGSGLAFTDLAAKVIQEKQFV